MRKVITNYDRLSHAKFAEKVSFMVFCLTGNPYFPALPFAPADMDSKKTAWEAKLYKSQQGDHVATEEAKLLRVELSNIVKKNGNHINDVAQGNVVKLESSGYDLTKIREYAPVAEVRFIQGEASGTGKIVIEAVEGAKCYLGFYCADPVPNPFNESALKRLPGTTKHYLGISGIEPGKLMQFYYCTISIDGESPMRGPFPFRLI